MATGHTEIVAFPQSPPYAPTAWQFGGLPSLLPDVPICAVYLCCYLIAAVIHQVNFLKNKRRGQKFVMSAMTFGFCSLRLITFSVRLAWAAHPRDGRLALVSNVLLNTGIPILYIINLVFAHRLTRAQHPRLGWHRSVSIAGRVVILMMLLTLVLLIYSGIQTAYTTDVTIHRITRDIQKFGSTFNCVIAFLPLLILLICLVVPKRVSIEKFGIGRFRIKVMVLMISSLLLTVRAIWSTTIIWLEPVPLSQPIPWFCSKPAFYTVQLLSELLVVYLFILVRINRIFYTPDGLPRGSYINVNAAISPNPQAPYGNQNFATVTTLGLYSEEELFEERHVLADTLRFSSTSLLLDSSSGKWKLQRQSLGDYYSSSFDGDSSRSRGSGSRGSTQSDDHAPADHVIAEKPPSSYSPSTWNQERYDKQRDSDSGTRSTKGVKSSRWSAPSKETNVTRYSFHKPSEQSNLRWSTPVDVGTSSGEVNESTNSLTEKRGARRGISSSPLSTTNSSSLQDPRPMSSAPAPIIYSAPISGCVPTKNTIVQPPKAQQRARSPLVTEAFEDVFSSL